MIQIPLAIPSDQQALDTLRELGSPPGGDSSTGAPHPTFANSLDPPPNHNTIACERLIRRTYAPHELASLIEAILPSGGKDETTKHLTTDDAQAFIDVMNEVSSGFNVTTDRLLIGIYTDPSVIPRF